MSIREPLLHIVECTQSIALAPESIDRLHGTATISLRQFYDLKAAYVEYIEASRRESWVLASVGKYAMFEEAT